MGSVSEFEGQFNDVLIVTELRGSYPNVPIAADVDYAALVAGDNDPQFLTLPIGMVNAKSGNDRYYDEAFVVELMRQTLANKPIGLMGHLSETERATAFPRESLHWVGAVRDGDLVWGKAYLIGEARERVRRYKASGKSIATSIDAYATGQWDESLKAYRMDASSLRLNQIDLAPSDRAGISALARVPMLTSEMQVVPDTQPTQEDSVMSIEQTIQELKKAKPTPKRGFMPSNAGVVTELAAIREVLGVGEDADLVRTVTEMHQEREVQAKAAIKTRITELALDPEKGVKLPAVRELVVELVNARNPQTVTEAESVYDTVLEMKSVKDALGVTVQSVMGPPQRTRVQPQQGQRKYFNIPAEKQEVN